MKREKLYVLSLAGLMVLAGGCGYSSQRPFRADVQTVYVKPFGSREFRRRIEMNLTEALKKRIQMDTNYRLSDMKTADTILKGEVIQVKQATLGYDFLLNAPRETQLTLVVSFQWKDLRSGKILVDRQGWLQTYEYAWAVGEKELDAINGAVDRMAETIVEQMMTEW